MPRFKTKPGHNPDTVYLSGDRSTGFNAALSKAQAYQLFYTSYVAEGHGTKRWPSYAPGGDSVDRFIAARKADPKSVPLHRRMWQWFDDDLIREFYALYQRGVSPFDYFKQTERKQVRVTLIVDAPKDMFTDEVYDEIVDLVNDVTEDTEIKVVV